MITINNTEVLGWEAAIRGMRNPMNSWAKCDSIFSRCDNVDCDVCPMNEGTSCSPTLYMGKIGPNDHQLMMSLAKGGPVHAKYRRMIAVYLDINAPLYWWKEFDTYKVGTVANSCSTMHKIHAKEFTLDDFSHEHLENFDDIPYDSAAQFEPEFLQTMQCIINMLNTARTLYLEAKTKPMKDESKRAGLVKKYWWQMIQLLPTSYNQKRTIMLSYEVLHNIYHSRRHHKLDEWRVFCNWIEELPYSEIIIGEQEA